MALVYAAPAIAREQILRAAARQFSKATCSTGGTRRRARRAHALLRRPLWLPFVTSFLHQRDGRRGGAGRGRSLPRGAAARARTRTSLHAARQSRARRPASMSIASRALDRSLGGAHGLPLMGSGDWNDGMNRVGHQGKGESVWVGWFLHTTLGGFAPSAKRAARRERGAATASTPRSSAARARRGGVGRRLVPSRLLRRRHAARLRANEECRIDSIAQSGASSPAPPTRTAAPGDGGGRRVPGAARRRLVMLFTPPFDNSALDPGYIKGYVPGVRENGGQYTHAALWTCSPTRCWATATARASCSRCSTRSTTPRRARGSTGTRSSPTSSRPMSTRCRRTPGGAAGPGTRALPAGCTASVWSRSSASGCAARTSLEPCIPRGLARYEITYRHGRRATIKVENPYGVSRGVAVVELDDALLCPRGIPLTDDGKPHRSASCSASASPRPKKTPPAPPQTQTVSGQTR